MICFVILHYQAVDETEKCVESILINTKGEKKIIIVDNASPNQSGKFLIEKYKNDNDVIKVILSKENVGFAKGNNVGYKAAKEYSPDYIVVLNSDTLLINNNFAEQLDKAFERYNFDVMGPDIFSTKTNSHQNPQRDSNFTLQELLQTRRKLLIKNRLKFLLKIKYMLLRNNSALTKSGSNYQSIQYNKVLHGAFYVYSKKYIEMHNECFYNKTFMYFESYILHYLGMKNDMKFLYYPNIQILHHEDASTDMTYKNQYKKSCFVNKCLLESCEVFIDLMKDEPKKIG